MDKKTIILTQIIMTFMMAVSMSGIMTLIAMGPTALWLSVWPRSALMAWPFAFVLGMVAYPAASLLAQRLLARARRNAPVPEPRPSLRRAHP